MSSSATDGYTSTTGTPPQDGGQLPMTGADIGIVGGAGLLLVAFGAALVSLTAKSRTPLPRDVAPAYLQGGVVPSTWNEE